MQGSAPAPQNHSASTLPTLLVLFGGVFLGALDIAIVGPALPAIQTELALNARQTAAIFSIYILFGLIGAPLIASLSDRRGRRRVYVACLLLFGLGSLLVATSINVTSLLLGRAVQAFGASGTLPVASAVIADTFPVERRGRALGIIGAVFGLAFVLGPLVGGLFLQWSWRWLFLVNLPLVVILISASIALLHDEPKRQVIGFDWVGTLLLACGLAALAFGATSLDFSAQSLLGVGSLALISFVAAAIFLWLFFRTEKRVVAPIIEPRLLQSAQLRIIGVLGLATGLVEASMAFLPTLAVNSLGVDPSRASFMLLPLVAALIAGSILAGRALDRFGSKPVIQLGMAVTIVGLMLFSWLPPGVASFYAAGIAVGLGLSSLLGAPLRFAALEEGGQSSRGASQGLLTVCLGIGRLFGASLTGSIAAGAATAAAGYRRSMFAIALAACVALIVSMRLQRR